MVDGPEHGRVAGVVTRVVLASDAHRNAIGSVTGVFRAIVNAIRRHTGVAVLQEHGLWALGSLACNGSWRSLCAMFRVARVVVRELMTCSRLPTC